MDQLLKSPPIGEILCRRGWLTEKKLSRALELQRRQGGRLGDILIGEDMIGYLLLYQALAVQRRLFFINLLETPPDATLLHAADADTYLKLRLIPWRREYDRICIALSEPSDEAMAWIRRRFGSSVRLAITSPYDIRRTVEKHFSESLESSSRLGLWRKLPAASARVMLPPGQKRAITLLLLASLAVIAIAPVGMLLMLLVLFHIAFAATMLFKCRVFVAGLRDRPKRDWQAQLAALDERTLPVYTVLVPMYKEAGSVAGLVEAMQRLDYPASKLDVKLVLEADDDETIAAALALKPDYRFEIVRVPPGSPRTKPRACNYALRFARGEYVAVFDADDRPEPSQLKKAVLAFRNHSAKVVCLQARLNYYNAHDNLLTRLFSLEYTMLFYVMLYGLERLGMPIPLGGTSNHIALKRLRGLGEWDPYNVTEDADLGARLASRGFKTVMLDSYTTEEAPVDVWSWIRQRSRWIKGYMQTWLVHMRDPAELRRRLGWKGFVGFQFFVGLSSFAFLMTPLVWILSVIWAGQLAHLYNAAVPAWVGWLSQANLLLYAGVHWAFALHCALLYRREIPAMVAAALAYPLYLILHSLASYRSLWQLIENPYLWEKTAHGMARLRPVPAQPRPEPSAAVPAPVEIRLTNAGIPR